MRNQESEKKFQLFFNAINDAIFVHPFQQEGFAHFIEVNDIACQRYGYSRDEFLQLTAMDITQKVEVEHHARVDHRQMLYKMGQVITEATHIKKSGERFSVEINANIIEQDGQPVILAVVRDISERKRAEKALQKSEERLELVIKGAELGLWDWTVPTGRVVFNECWAQMLGYRLDEIEPNVSNWEKLMHPDEIETVTAILTEHLEGRTPVYQIEHRLRAKSGAWKWILDTGKVFERDEQGKPVRVVGTHQDITERKQAEQVQATTLEQFKALIGNLQMGVLVETANRQIIHTNRAFCDLFGIPAPEAILGGDCDASARGASLLFQDPPRFIEQVRNILAKGKVVVNEELHLKDGRIFERDYVPVYVRGDFIGNMWIYRDITERKQADAENIKLLNVIERSSNEIYIFDAQTLKFQYINGGAVRNLGYSLDELEEFTPIDIKPELTEESFRVMIQPLLLHEQERLIFETIHRRSNGSTYPVEVFLQLVKTQSSELFLAVINDITDRKQMEQQLVQQERLAAVGQLSAGIAHDFNNILTAILGFTELLQLSPNTPGAMQSSLKKIGDSSQRAAHLVRQILDFSQKTIREPQQVDLSSLVEKAIKFLENIIPENIQVDLNIEPNNYLIEADPTQLQQVITNLVVNSEHAMPGGGELHIELSRGECATNIYCTVCNQPIKGEWAQLKVTDTGSGIAADVLLKVFEPFFTTKEIGAGSGLGLSQVSGIVAQHGGHIRVESKVDEGTTFTIYLRPLITKEKPSQPKAGQMRQGQGETILLVEDEPTVLEAATAMLELLGYQVLAASTGTEAITIFEAYKPQIALVLSDMAMPDMDGERLFHHLKTVKPDLKMVMMSGYPLGEKGAKLLKQGVVAWFQKPMPFGQLSQVVNNALSNKTGRWE